MSKFSLTDLEQQRVVADDFLFNCRYPGQRGMYADAAAPPQETMTPVRTTASAPTPMATLRNRASAQASDATLAIVKQAIDAAATTTGVDRALLYAIAEQESRFNPLATSPAGAVGLFQLMPDTARGLGVTDRTDPVQSAQGGATYIKQQLASFSSVNLALAAYNAGPGAVRKFNNTVPPYAETQKFVPEVIARYNFWRTELSSSTSSIQTLSVRDLITTLPVQGTLTSKFGMRTHPISGKAKLHTGIDIAAPTGTSIYAVAAGTIITAESRGGYGNLVVIDHGNGRATWYAHMNTMKVRVGDAVAKRAVIGTVGSTGMATGPHCHFEIRLDGVAVDPYG